MSVNAAQTPAWLAELSQEWVEPQDPSENITSSSNESSSGEQQQQQGSMMDFGSIVVKDSLPRSNFGTMILHDNSRGSIRSPTKSKKTLEKSQLAWAIAGLAKSGGNILAEQTPKTSRLQRLFMEASPSPSAKQDEPVPILATEEDQEEDEEEPVQKQVDDIAEEQEEDAEKQEASIVILEPKLKPPSADFSFHVEKSRAKSWKAHLPPPTPTPSESEALTTSTPPVAQPGRKSSSSTSAPSPSLGIFKFHHDTYTRQHLQALVEEIDGLASPPRQTENNDQTHLEDNTVWNETLEGLRRTIDATGHAPLPHPHLLGAEEEDEDGRMANTRSSKRVRLSMSDLRPPSLPSSPARQILATLSQTPNSSANRERLARKYPHTARRLAMSASTPSRPVLRSLPPMSMPVRRTTLRSSMLAPTAEHPELPVETPRAPRMASSDVKEIAKTPAVVVRNRLEEAKALMERIRLRASEREGNDRGDLGISNATQRPAAHVGTARPPNPTPMAATLGHQFLLPPMTEEREEDRQDDDPPVAEEEEQQTNHKDDQSTRHDETQGEDTLQREERDQVAPLPEFDGHAQAAASIRQALSASPLPSQVQQYATGSIASSSSVSGGTGGRRTFATAPLSRQSRQPVSFSSQASSDRFFTSTSTRLPSGSTAATSLIASQAGSIKSHGIIYITPAEAEQLLTKEVLGDMVYDEQHQRWVKQQLQQQQEPGGLSRIEEVSGQQTMLEHSEDDPFRDITGFESSKSLEHVRNSSQDRNRSGSLILLPVPRAIESDRRSEKTSTPPLADVAAPLVSPDLPSIPAREPNFQQLQTTRREPPRSALKTRENTFSTPMPASRATSSESCKQSRSVSFSDGRLSGKIAVVRNVREAPPASTLRNEVEDTATEGDEEEESEAESHRSEDSTNPLREANTGPTHLTSTIIRPQTSQWHASHAMPENGIDFDNIPPPHESSSAQSTPTALFPVQGRNRSLRLRSRHLSQSVISTTSTTAWHRKPINANATILTECSFGVSYDRLLQVLTDVAPFEPSWKDLRSIDLKNRAVESIVRLKEFLPNLDEADLSNNNLSYLTGLSAPIRFLSLATNKLSDLTSFSHIRNLETVDISNNPSVTSVHQFACLNHLRTLKADQCNITGISGIDQLDGLVSISLKGNKIDRVRLETTAWRRLESLDLSDNEIVEATGVETLAMLKVLNLDNNKLYDFSVAAKATELRILKLCSNSLDNLDLSNMPNLRTIFADNNRISEVTGAEHLKNLENLSLREQKQSSVSFPVRELRDIRRLYLSHNPIPSSFPTEQFLNLTLLELASCRLTSLPSNFSSLVPNCRVLILDHNVLDDFTPLKGLARLKRLSAVGTRVEKVKGVLQTIASLLELELLDLRLSPMTLSFYPPLHTVVQPSSSDEDKLFKAQDAQYRRSLPDEWLAKRSAYRSLLVDACPSLKMLDGLKVGRKQRERAKDLVERFSTF